MQTKESNVIENTKAFWEKRTGKPVSGHEAKEMVDNVSGFFQVLDEMDRQLRKEEEISKKKEKEKNETA